MEIVFSKMVSNGSHIKSLHVTEVFNDFCNFLLKASTFLLTCKEADKLNQCGAHIAIIFILLLLNAQSENKVLNLSYFSLYFEFDHIQPPDCGSDCFPMGIRLSETSYIIGVV